MNGKRNVLKDRIWREDNKERRKAYREEWFEKHPGKKYNYNKIYRQKNPDKYREMNRNKMERNRLKLFDIIQPANKEYECAYYCNMCGIKDIRVLQIDHIHSKDSKEDRKRFKSNGSMHTYYRRHPEEARQKLQIVCSNCNIIRCNRYAQCYIGKGVVAC